jgi:hypothetical protein
MDGTVKQLIAWMEKWKSEAVNSMNGKVKQLIAWMEK